MRDAGLVESDEPFTRLLTQGMVIAESFYREQDSGQKEYFNRNELDISYDDKGRIDGALLKADGKPVTVGRIEKMSKSKNNGVDPLEMIERYGADTMRLFSVSDTPPHQSLEWKEGGVEGMHRFLKRVWREVSTVDASFMQAELDPDSLTSEQKTLRRKTHETTGKVTDDIERRMTFNIDEAWPEVDEDALTRDELELVVQVNGKRRASITVAASASKEDCEAAALADSAVQKHIQDLNVVKVIVVPGRLVNIVAK